MKKALNGLLLMLLVLVGVVWAAPTKAYAGGYISEVVTKKGDSGKAALEKANYQVVLPSLKSGGSEVWIGYKSTSNKADAITKLVGDNPTSLHGTKSEGKSAIKEIYITNSKEKFSKVLPLDNLGSMPVVDSKGEPVVFETKSGSAYINTISENLYKPYIAQIHIAKASNKKQAVTKLLKEGCQFFVDKDMDGSDGECVMIGYIRTADEDKAITDIIGLSKDIEEPKGYKEADKQTISDKKIYVTYDKNYGNPLMDIDAIKGILTVDIKSDELVKLIASRGQNQVAKSFFISDGDYKKMSEEKNKCIITGIDTDDANDIGIVYAAEKKGFSEKKTNKRKALAEVLKQAETKNDEVVENDEEETEKVNDSYDEPKVVATEKEAVTEQVAEDNKSQEVEETTVINEEVEGAGSIVNKDAAARDIEITILVILGILIPIVTVLAKRKIERPKTKKK